MGVRPAHREAIFDGRTLTGTMFSYGLRSKRADLDES